MSALPPKADIGTQPRNFRFVPEGDIKGIGSPVCGASDFEDRRAGSREYSTTRTGRRANGKYEFKTGAAGVGF